jgi:lipoprotein-anchoring transpeptidase ErfK/SrfK
VVRSYYALALAAAVIGCTVDDATEEETPAPAPVSQPAATPAPATPTMPAGPDSLAGLHFIVDISDRKLYVLSAQDTLRTEDVAVGTQKHPTPTGEWTINRVDWNPDWTPPPGEEWTEDKEPQPPGSPENPMGRARLVFQPPYTIHGTKERQSLGKAASHGSIRVANEVVVQLGRMIMAAGGAPKPESFFQEVQANRKEMHKVDIPRPIPIRVQQ